MQAPMQYKDLASSFGRLFGAFRRAVLLHCPEGFRGGLEHDWVQDSIVLRLRCEGVDGSVTKAIDRQKLVEWVELGLDLAAYPAAEYVIPARDRLMLETMPR